MPQSLAPLLAIDASPNGSLSEVLRLAAQEAMFALTLVRTVEEALAKISEQPFYGVLVPVECEGVAKLCAAVRAHATASSMPVIGLAAEVSEQGFVAFLRAGGDDVSGCVYEEIVPRLRSVRGAWAAWSAGARPAKRGVAVLGDANIERRGVTARVLRGAGFEVRFAGCVEELAMAAELAGAEASLYVVDAHLPPGGAIACIAARRAAGKREPWVVEAAPGELASFRRSMRGLSAVGFHDALSPSENIVFIANELARCAGDEARAAPRALYGTRCFLRAAGHDRETVGFTYNVSATGLYVRTLYPFAVGDEVWVEMTPAHADRRVRLEAKVIWRRNFGVVTEPTAPPGVALQLTGGSTGDCDRFLRSSHEVAVELGLASDP